MIRTIDNRVGALRARNTAEFNLRIYREFLYFTDSTSKRQRSEYLTRREIETDSRRSNPTIPSLAAECVAKQEREVRVVFSFLDVCCVRLSCFDGYI